MIITKLFALQLNYSGSSGSSTVPYGWSENESNKSSFAETPDKPNFKLVLKGQDLMEVGSTHFLCSHTLIFTQHTLIHVLVLIIRFGAAIFLIQVVIHMDGILVSIVQMRAVSLVQMRAWRAVLIQIPQKIQMNEI